MNSQRTSRWCCETLALWTLFRVRYTSLQLTRCGQNNPQLNTPHQHRPEDNSQSEIAHMRVTRPMANQSWFYSNDPMRLELMYFLQDTQSTGLFLMYGSSVWHNTITKPTLVFWYFYLNAMAAYMAHFMALSFKNKTKDVPDYFFQKTLHLDLRGTINLLMRRIAVFRHICS